jgi:hypothetical protein
MKQIITNIHKCIDCPYYDHSGAFTPGGAISICQHNEAPYFGTLSGLVNFLDIKKKERAEIVFGPRKLNDDMSIPDWCPLGK